jgi:peptidoglycan hydrolase-like protein with peptidoglycan-binding domain
MKLYQALCSWLIAVTCLGGVGCAQDRYAGGFDLAEALPAHTQDSMAEGQVEFASRTKASAPAPAPAPAPAAGEAAPPPETPAVASIQRQVIYTATLTVLSPDPDGAVESVKQIAQKVGGYATTLRGQQITVRIPADRFDAVMADIAKLGLVTDRAIDASDVTEQLLDLQIRLDNLQTLRGRLKDLVQKADKVEDAIKIEKELARLTGEIEQIEGKLRFLRDRVALSTITVTFNAPKGTASGLAARVRPFPWVNTIGAEAFGAAPLPHAQPQLGKAAQINLPEGFVRFFQQDYRVYAINREQVVLKLTRQLNYDKAAAGFWSDQVRARLTEDLGVPVQEPTQITLAANETGFVLTGSRAAGKEKLGYFVGLSASADFVYLVEAWGPADQLTAQRDALIDSLKTLRVNRGWW